MRLLCQTKFQMLIIFVAATSVCMTGCKSQRGFPKLSDLAWWQKDDARLAETLPPAAHFDPEPAVHMQASSNNKSARDEIAAIVAEAAKNNTDKERYALNGQPPTHPIRTPYSFDAARKSSSAGESETISDSTSADDNSFASTPGKIKTKLPDWDSSGGPEMPTDAKDVQPAATNSWEIAKSKLDSSNKTPIATGRSAAQSDEAWRTDFALPAKSSAGLNANIEAARKSLNRVEENAANEFAGFKQSLNNSIDRAADPINKFAEQATEIKEQVAQAAEFKSNPHFNGFEPAQPAKQQPESDNPSELARIQIAAQRFQENADQLQKLADQARQQAAELAKQANLSSNPIAPKDFGQMAMQNQPKQPETAGFQPRVAQLYDAPQLPSNSLRNSMSNSQSSSLSPMLPANSLQPNQGAMYPSTPHRNYAPKDSVLQQQPANPDIDSSQVSFYGAPNSSQEVATAGGGGQLSPIPAGHDSGGEFSSGDVVVPDAIMFGSSSFAPGSVNQLVPSGK